jgi:hypothetical protein
VLNQVADGVWVRQSEWVWTNSIVVRGEDGLIVIDPGIHGSERGEERNPPTRAWMRTGSPAPTNRTWSTPEARAQRPDQDWPRSSSNSPMMTPSGPRT